MSVFLASFTWSHSYWGAKPLFTWTDLATLHASWVHNHMSPLLVTKHRSSLPVVRHEKKPWVISRTAGLADFVFFRAPWNVPPRWWPQFPQLGGLLRLKYSTWHLGHEPRPRLLITNTNQEQTHTTRKPYNKRFTRLKKMKLNLTRKPNNNKRLTHVQLKQIKTQSKNLLITTKPNKNVCLNHIWLLLWLYSCTND